VTFEERLVKVGLIQLVAVTAERLGGVHGEVGVADRDPGFAALLQQVEPHAGPDRQRLAGEVHGLAEHLDDAPGAA
jgi:hypothetical protein